MTLFVPDVFEKLHVKEFFVSELYEQCHTYAQDHSFIAEISRTRLLEAYILWKEDMARSLEVELTESKSIDEYKQCGHLAYWLRRFNPYNEILVYEEAASDTERSKQEFFLRYGPHYTAFMIGFELCSYATANAEGSPFYKSDFRVGNDYFNVVSHFLKTKDVSPHSMYLIYKSIFLNPFTGKAFEYVPSTVQ